MAQTFPSQLRSFLIGFGMAGLPLDDNHRVDQDKPWKNVNRRKQIRCRNKQQIKIMKLLPVTLIQNKILGIHNNKYFQPI